MITTLEPGTVMGSLRIVDGKPFCVEAEANRQRVRFGDERSLWYPNILDLTTGGGMWLFGVKDGEKYVVVHGPVQYPAYDYVSDPWCEDGESTSIYYAQDAGKYFAVEGMREGKPYRRVWDSDKADGRLFYKAVRGKELVVWGDWESDEHEEVSDLTVRDGILYYAAKDAAGKRVFKGEHAYPPYDDISGFTVLHGDPLYAAWDARRMRIVHGWKEDEPHDAIWDLRVAGNEILYCARDGADSFVVRRGTGRSASFPEVWSPGLVDDELLFTAGDGQKYFVSWGSYQSHRHDGVLSPQVLHGELVYRSMDRGCVSFWRGKRVSRAYRSVDRPITSGDDIIHRVSTDEGECVVRNFDEDPFFAGIGEIRTFGGHLVYTAWVGDGWAVVSSGRGVTESFDAVFNLALTDEGAIFYGRKNLALFRVVLPLG